MTRGIMIPGTHTIPGDIPATIARGDITAGTALTIPSVLVGIAHGIIHPGDIHTMETVTGEETVTGDITEEISLIGMMFG